MSKNCLKCGSELEDVALFCDECGAQQTEQPSQANKQQTKVDTKRNQYTSQSVSKDTTTNTEMKNSGFGITSFIFGIISILTLGCVLIPEILGFTFGILALLNKKSKHVLAITGSILSVISFILFVLIVFV